MSSPSVDESGKLRGVSRAGGDAATRAGFAAQVVLAVAHGVLRGGGGGEGDEHGKQQQEELGHHVGSTRWRASRKARCVVLVCFLSGGEENRSGYPRLLYAAALHCVAGSLNVGSRLVGAVVDGCLVAQARKTRGKLNRASRCSPRVQLCRKNRYRCHGQIDDLVW